MAVVDGWLVGGSCGAVVELVYRAVQLPHDFLDVLGVLAVCVEPRPIDDRVPQGVLAGEEGVVSWIVVAGLVVVVIVVVVVAVVVVVVVVAGVVVVLVA